MSEEKRTDWIETAEKVITKNLVVKNGKVSCVDGQGVVAYLNKWIKQENVKDGEFLNVTRRKTLVKYFVIVNTFKDGDFCDFCFKTLREAKHFIKSKKGWICNECVDVCNDIIADEKAKIEGKQNEK